MSGCATQKRGANVLNSSQRLTLPAAENLWSSSLDINTMHEFYIVLWKIYAAYLID
jgi:hypothetical protein